ncbi:MAG TPA: hypothetical protein VHR97_12870 [Candidatus Baltobacteraceae bacterium]|jgi:hypothetical protein|nr:hypothetical protein [Candidatus Baltobacteraceae bacterium]
MSIGSWLHRLWQPVNSAARSRTIAVLGMHRSGTSAITRGVAALGVFLGNDFLDAQPENPTGYWEDKGIVDLNERVLGALGLTWDAVAPVDLSLLDSNAARKLRRTAGAYIRRAFCRNALWGFKDPRTMRVLPFWLDVFAACAVDDAYLLVIRNPMSVAKSLFARQQMPLETALQLWLAYGIPFFDRTAGKVTMVVDYDRFMIEPRRELQRIAHGLAIDPSENEVAREIDRFTNEFLDEKLRHTVFSIADVDASTSAGRIARDAYALLFDLACDVRRPDAAFWSQWESLALRYTSNLAGSGEGNEHG